MDNDIKTWLYDILQSINEIDSYYDDNPMILSSMFLTLRQKGRLSVIWK
jgi:hypothetical protein